MVKAKSRTIVMATDGAGGVMKVTDLRFERSDWPITFEVPVEREQAERWTRYLRAECERRGWTASSFGQIERAENSVTITITANGKPQLELVWERKRLRSVKVKVRCAAGSGLSSADAEQFCKKVNDDCNAGTTQEIYLRGTLRYDGRAWRGEYWLDDKTRLAPPSLQDEMATDNGPRIVHVDAKVDCISKADDTSMRQQLLLEVSAFLSVVTGTAFRLADFNNERAWVWKADMTGCEARQIGYLEPSNPLTMPARNTVKQVPLYNADNPPTVPVITEISLRDDTADLWSTYRNLEEDKRVQFLQAAVKWQEARMLWPERPSLSYTLMVIACEALKPSDAADRQKCYDVVNALLGAPAVERIRNSPYPAQRMRNTHLHTGEFQGWELELVTFFASYRDPSFGDAVRKMAEVTPAVIIAWLKCGGIFQMPAPNERSTLRRWLKDNLLLSAALIFGLGLAFGWLLSDLVAKR
jgi:hypothetical protein